MRSRYVRASLPAVALLAVGLILPAGALAQLVTGQVVDADVGAPIGQALVHLLDEEGGRVSTMPTDGAGRFLLQAPEPGTYRIEATRPGYVAAASEVVEVTAGEVEALPPLELVLDPEAIENLPVPPLSVAGRVLAEGFDEPMPSVLVRLVDNEGAGVEAVMTDLQGRYRLRAPVPGRYRVEVLRLGTETAAARTVELDEERGERLTLEIPFESVVHDPDEYRDHRGIEQGRAQFSRRREQGLGIMLTAEDISQMEDVTLPSHIFFFIPGMTMRYDARGLPMVTSFLGWQCVFVVGAPPDLDDLRLDQITAIEIYPSFREVPQELRTPDLWPPRPRGRGGRGPCGLVVVWTDVAW